jgi:deferrochelatase/peroxidase EfeB
MSDQSDAGTDRPQPTTHPNAAALSRRQLLARSGLASAALLATAGSSAAGAGLIGSDAAGAATSSETATNTPVVPFFGTHQAGIVTPEQSRMVFAAYDLALADRAALAGLLAQWTRAAEELTAGKEITGPSGPFVPPSDTGEALGLGPSRLTLTVGFGPTMFDGRFELQHRRPAALVDLPPFAGDDLDPTRTGGDVCIQACADDPQVAFHAVHNLTRAAEGAATLRYLETGFGRAAASGVGQATPRNLLGFHDGTDNLVAADPQAMDRFVWVGSETDQPWMVGGTYLVARRIRIHLEAWGRSTLEDQQNTIGRVKASGAPLGGTSERDPVDFDAVGDYGQSVIPETAHIRVAAPSSNDGHALLRRGYSFADGIDPESGELDAGLYFICFQKDPRNQFIPIQRRLAENDALSQYLLPTGGGIFACPPGPAPGRTWGQALF